MRLHRSRDGMATSRVGSRACQIVARLIPFLLVPDLRTRVNMAGQISRHSCL